MKGVIGTVGDALHVKCRSLATSIAERPHPALDRGEATARALFS
jgi:hypothetical protein